VFSAITRAFAPGADAPPLSDRGAIDRLFRNNRLLIMLAITGGYGLAYTCRLALGVVKKPLIDAGIFSPADLGLIGSAFFYTYAFGKLINGFLADHANPRVFLAFGILVSALVNIAMGFNTAILVAVVLWGLNGWFQSMGAPASVVSLSQWFSNHERGRYYGIWSTAHSIGEGLTFVATGAIVGALGWRAGFWGPGVLCILTAFGCLFLMKDRPQTLGLPKVSVWRHDEWNQAPPPPPTVSLLKTQLSILAIPAVWILAISSALMYVTRYAINSWGVLYLQEARGYSLTEAASLLAINTVTGIVGAVAFGYISDKFFKARRPPVNLIFGIMEIAGLLLVFFGPNNVWVLSIGLALFGLGLTGLVTSVGGLFATDICPKRVSGAALGAIGVFSYLGAAVQENISGHLIEAGMKTIDGVKHYDFGPSILFWVGCSVVSLILATTLWNVKLRD
jgi:OPA family sugar phosphate sensor protein UhpC-like MFS transporter